jgi:selenide,water dikinase
MGGDPLMAIAILGWPVQKLAPEIAKEVLEGSRKVCQEAGIPLAGGHSIDSPEPIFGLAVTGTAKKEHLKQNNTARPGSRLYLTKPLGIGIITTAEKKGIVEREHLQLAVDSMLRLNVLGSEFGKVPYVNAMTDVTGFGLLGHLGEMCEGSGLSAEITFDKVPRFDFLDDYVRQKSIPGGTGRNWESYGSKISALTDAQIALLADPQTSGGLLVSVNASEADQFETLANSKGCTLHSFGRLVEPAEHVVIVR